METNDLLASLVFGGIGAGFFMYGKRAGRMIPLCSGLALMGVPYFIPNLVAMTIVCGVITAVPWFLRGA